MIVLIPGYLYSNIAHLPGVFFFFFFFFFVFLFFFRYDASILVINSC